MFQYLMLVSIFDLGGIIYSTGKKLRVQVVSYTKLLMKHVYRALLFSYARGHAISKWKFLKVNNIYLNIAYKLVFPEDQGKHRRY